MILLDSFENNSQNLSLDKKSVEDKHWMDLTLEEISLIKDNEKRYQYRKSIKNFFMCIINPLYRGIKNKNKFAFSNSNNLLTCRNMIKDLMRYYYQKGYTKDEIINIASENDYKKRY